MEFVRRYPIHKNYPWRYTNEVFDRFNEMYSDEIRENCNKWKEGINPYTNRKIKIGGKTYDSIKDDFVIYFLYGTRWTWVFYLKLVEIDQEIYKEETIQLNREIDRENKVISSKIKQIKCLKSWNDFVIYNGIKYGLKKVVNHVHRENDCFGKMERQKCRGNFKCNKCGYEE